MKRILALVLVFCFMLGTTSFALTPSNITPSTSKVSNFAQFMDFYGLLDEELVPSQMDESPRVTLIEYDGIADGFETPYGDFFPYQKLHPYTQKPPKTFSGFQKASIYEDIFQQEKKHLQKDIYSLIGIDCSAQLSTWQLEDIATATAFTNSFLPHCSIRDSNIITIHTAENISEEQVSQELYGSLVLGLIFENNIGVEGSFFSSDGEHLQNIPVMYYLGYLLYYPSDHTKAGINNDPFYRLTLALFEQYGDDLLRSAFTPQKSFIRMNLEGVLGKDLYQLLCNCINTTSPFRISEDPEMASQEYACNVLIEAMHTQKNPT